jgi:hypothetical protein
MRRIQIDLPRGAVEREMNGLALSDLQNAAIDIVDQLVHNSSRHGFDHTLALQFGQHSLFRRPNV